jgi:perosamine synthetase
LGRGKYVDQFEEKMAEYFHVNHAIALSNGTMADLVMLLTLKVMYPDRNEVILPAFTFVAQANAVVMAGLKPVFVDVNDEYQIDWTKVRTNDKTLCVFPANLIGKFSGEYLGTDIPMIEDCCESMGGDYCYKKFGTFGIAGAFSMFPSHTITTGEGGLIITNDPNFNEIARSIMNHGKWRSNDFDFKFFGINAKMTNMQAAVGCALVDRVDSVNIKRRKNVELYNMLLGNYFFAEAPHCYPIIYDSFESREQALVTLRSHNIEARKLMGCIPDYNFYRDAFDIKETFPMATRFASCGLFVPIHQNLKQSEIERICDVIELTR